MGNIISGNRLTFGLAVSGGRRTAIDFEDGAIDSALAVRVFAAYDTAAVWLERALVGSADWRCRR
jgi:hypothetical protein